MPDGSNQLAPKPPRDRHMCVLLGEIYLLLSYIQGVPDKHLTKYFGEGAQSIQERDDAPVPPTWDLTYFLGRIAAIESSGPNFDPGAITQAGISMPTAPPNPPATSTEVKADADPAAVALPASKIDTGPKMTDLAFLIWTQDFLSAVAAPVSVETLMVTQAFRVARMNGLFGWLGRNVPRLWGAKVLQPSGAAVGPGSVPLPPDSPLDPKNALTSEHATLQAYGKSLARRVSFMSWITGGIIVFTVWSSALVYTGRVLVRENATLQAAYKELNIRMALADKDEHAELLKTFKDEPAVKDGATSYRNAFYCEISLPPLPIALKELTPLVAGVAAPSTATDWSPDRRTYLSSNERNLCAEYARLEQRSVELKEQHGLWVRTASPFRYFMSPGSLISSPRPIPGCERKDILCVMRKLDLETHRYAMEQVVDGFIGGVLPVTYALLGSLAALFRNLNARADASRLSPADYGSIRNTTILGVITGSVIGLFSDSLGWGAHESASIPLASTALALLGGFASERVFAMFESLSMQVFGKVTTPTLTASGLKSAG